MQQYEDAPANCGESSTPVRQHELATRCCSLQKNFRALAAAGNAFKSQFGERESLLVAGGIGGPFTIWLYTPLRNAIR